jgi:hypothetical protein
MFLSRALCKDLHVCTKQPLCGLAALMTAKVNNDATWSF